MKIILLLLSTLAPLSLGWYDLHITYCIVCINVDFDSLQLEICIYPANVSPPCSL